MADASPTLEVIAWGLIDNGIEIAVRGASVSRNGLGSYYIELSEDRQIDDSELMFTGTISDTNNVEISFCPVSDLIKEACTFNSQTGSRRNARFYFKIERLAVGG
jgi:hypothetical protein